METVLRLNREKGITVILITHHMDEAARRAGWWCCIEGQIMPPTAPPKEGIFPRWTWYRLLELAAPDTVELCWELDRKSFHLPLAEAGDHRRMRQTLTSR